MVLGWFKGKEESVDELVARREWGKAAEHLRDQLKKSPKDVRIRQNLADVLTSGGHGREAVDVLLPLADDFVNDGFVAKAIAILKKIQKIDPGRTDVEEKLAGLVEVNEAAVHTGPFRKSDVASAIDPGTAPADDPSTEDFDLGFEDAAADEVPPGPAFGAEAPTVAAAAPAEPARPASAPAAADPLAEAPGDSTTVRKEKAEERRWREIAATPLFTDFTKEELVAVIRGMRLRVFEDGEVIVTEKEPGNSLFVITTGRVKVSTTNPKGQQIHLAALVEGDFFGEVAVLTGKPRTATITAASRSEVLELDRPTLEGIAAAHPHVKEVLEDFYRQRVDKTVEAMIASLKR